MALATIGETILVAGAPSVGAEVTVTIVAATAGTAFGYTTVATEGGRRRAATDATGAWSLGSVAPNVGSSGDVITSPSGTVYRIDVRHRDGTVMVPRFVEVPDSVGPHDIVDILTVAPDAIVDSAVEQAIDTSAASLGGFVQQLLTDGDVETVLPDWTDASVASSAFDALAVLGGKLVVPSPETGGNQGTNAAGHGFIYKDFASLGSWAGTRVSVSGYWTGERPYEATPLIHIDTTTDEYGLGVWPISDFAPGTPGNQSVLWLGAIGRDNTFFDDFLQLAVPFSDLPDELGGLVVEKRYKWELRSWDGEWSLWIDGYLVGDWLPIPTALLGSTVHGMALDNNQSDGNYGAGGAREANKGALEGPFVVARIQAQDGEPVAVGRQLDDALRYKADERLKVDRAGDTITGDLLVDIDGVGVIALEEDILGGAALTVTQDGDTDTTVGLGSISGVGALSLGDGAGNQAYLVHAGDDILLTPGKIQQSTAASASTDLVRLNEAVLKSLFDANTILAATSDNTPVALTVGASTVVGRAASGGIVALTPAQLRTIIDLAAQIGATAVGGDLTGTVSNAQITAGAIVNADINAAAQIDGTKVNYATVNAQGATELATDAEALGLASTSRVLTPSNLAAVLAALFAADATFTSDRLSLENADGKIRIETDANDSAATNHYRGAETYPRAVVGHLGQFSLSGLFAGLGVADPDTYWFRSLTTAGVWTASGGGIEGIGKGVVFTEQSDPSAPAANGATLYARDNGSGKTQLCVRFNTGAVQVIATQP